MIGTLYQIYQYQHQHQSKPKKMIEKKLDTLKKLMESLDQQKLQNNHKIDSIALISQKLSRTNKSSIAPRQQTPRKQQPSLSFTVNLNPRGQCMQRVLKLAHKTQSLREPSPRRSPNQLMTYVNEENRKRMEELARRLYQARVMDMKIKESQIGWQEFLKTFLLKNSKNGEYKADRVDLSGLGVTGNCIKVVSTILGDFKIIDLSRNLIKTVDIANVKTSKRLHDLILKNCGMKNEELCMLFKLLLGTPIKRLSICSPDIKDRNNLTRYSELYELIENSETLQCLQLSNIQISPQCTIFNSAKKSKNLKRLDLSKNTGVSGMAKNLTHLNLSWNGLKKTTFLRCVDSQLQKLDLTGNPIPCYLFEQYLAITNYPTLKSLTLNKVPLIYECMWLQNFIDKSRSIEKLSLVDCQMPNSTLMNICIGLQHNKSLKSLNLSGNNMSNLNIAQRFATSLKASVVSHLQLELCGITDESGAVIFQALKDNTYIQFIDVSKNLISQKTSETICNCLKSSCYSLLTLITTQNFIKYGQLKQIQGYIERNIFMAKTKVLEEHRRYKNMNASNTESIRKIQQAQKQLQVLRQETMALSEQYMKKQKQNEAVDGLILQQKLRLLAEQQVALEKKRQELKSEIDRLHGHNPQLQENN